MSHKVVQIPDLGGAQEVTLIEWLVKPGDEVSADTPLATLESDKATMEVPAPNDGVIESLGAVVGQKLAQGDNLLLMRSLEKQAEEEVDILSVDIPDLGGIAQAKVVEVLVKVGDQVNENTSLLTLESEKATMDVPSPYAGKVLSTHVVAGEDVKMGQMVVMIAGQAIKVSAPKITQDLPVPEIPIAHAVPTDLEKTSPIVRRLAYELGIQLGDIQASGPKGRILKDDLIGYIKQRMQGKKSVNLPDFTQFGSVKLEELGRIKQISGPFLQDAWQLIPHVTHFFEVDFTELENYRKANQTEFVEQGTKLTPVLFFVKALIPVLRAHPIFASSLSEDGKSLWMKDYINIGIAVDTPGGLMVPVLKNVDQKSFIDLAIELSGLSTQAREGALKVNQMQGGTMTISSLGGIGGVAFTPIINAPEVCILGISKGYIKPVWDGQQFIPRYTVPLSLSYDHRVIDGAEAARFCNQLQRTLETMHLEMNSNHKQ